MNYIGTDISKKTFDVAIAEATGYKHYKISNDEAGFKTFLKLLNKDNDCCVMEASGPYYQQLAVFLQTNNIAVSVVNPLIIRRFCQMRLTRAKTDKKDAVMIAEYGKTEKPELWQVEEAYLLELRQMQTYLHQLNKNRTGLLRQMEAFSQSIVMSKEVKKSLSKMIKSIEEQMADLEKKMEEIINKHHGQMYKQIQSIPGIGKKTGMQLIVTGKAFTKFKNAKQLSSYIGLSPRIYESGTSVKGKVRMCKMGMSRMRAMLYVCTWSAIKCNKACKDLYERLTAKGKAKQVALIAVANKLLKQAFAIVTKNQFYKADFI